MRFRSPVVLVPALLALALSPVRADAAKPVYVALGDSYAAGPVIPLQEPPWSCIKSTNNYAHHVASTLGATLRDATCSGAETDDMTKRQGGNPPQFNRLDASVDLVTLQIGGNDIGFSGIAETCIRAGLAGTSCKGEYVDPATGRDELRDRIAETAPKVGAVLDGIAARSPGARVLVLGYPGIFAIGPTASCPAMGVGEDDAVYLRGVEEALNAMIADQAASHGATYVDVYGPSAGHTACDLPVIRWVEPIVPVNAAAPIHPNLEGMLAMADLVTTAANSTIP
jgi:lysophospholipase L1-like esterase